MIRPGEIYMADFDVAGPHLRTGQFGFSVDCVAQCENIASIEKVQLDLDAGPVGALDELAMRDIIKAVGYVMESECEPL